jgi:hypothetical protein
MKKIACVGKRRQTLGGIAAATLAAGNQATAWCCALGMAAKTGATV